MRRIAKSLHAYINRARLPACKVGMHIFERNITTLEIPPTHLRRSLSEKKRSLSKSTVCSILMIDLAFSCDFSCSAGPVNWRQLRIKVMAELKQFRGFGNQCHYKSTNVTTTKKGKEPIKGQLSLHYPGSHAFYVPIMSLLTILYPAVTLVLL